MNWESIQQWFMSLGATYGVNPIVFGSIYVGAIPFFTLSVAWIIRNRGSGRDTTLPVLSSSFWFVSAYVYLLIVGHDIPLWVYAFLAGMMGFGIYSTVTKIRRQSGRETRSRG